MIPTIGHSGKRNYGNNENISGCQGLREERGINMSNDDLGQ